MATLTASTIEHTNHDRHRDDDANQEDQTRLMVTNKDELLLIRSFRKLKEDQQRNVHPCSTSTTAEEPNPRPTGGTIPQNPSCSKRNSSVSQHASAQETSSLRQQTLDPRANTVRRSQSKPSLVFGEPSIPHRHDPLPTLKIAASPFGNYGGEESPFSQLARQKSRISLAESRHQERKSPLKNGQSSTKSLQ